MYIQRLAHVALLISPILIFGWLLLEYVNPSGEKVVRYEVGDISPFVQRFLPDDRVSAVQDRDGDAFVTLLDEPVYFSITPPAGNFSTVTVEMAFDPDSTPTLELGGLKDLAAQAFDFRPLSHNLLETSAWTRHDLPGGEGLVVFSRDADSPAYKTFLETPPDRAKVASYRVPFPTPFRLPNYTSLGIRQTFAVSLRGPHELLTYVKNEPFAFEVMYTDVNRTYGADEGFVKVLDEQGNVMTEFVFRDDGNIYDNQSPSPKTTVLVQGEDWPEGVYRIVLSGTSDILWRELSTPQRYLVVKNRVFLGDEVGYLPTPRATSVFTDAKQITLETQHREGLQTVQLGSESLTLERVGQKYVQSVPGSGVVEVASPVGDIKLTGEGKYAFTRQAFFNPDPLPLTAFTDLDATEVEHVLANLAPVRFVDGWRVASATYNVNELAEENGAYKFTLSAPGVHQGQEQVAVHGVTVTFQKPSLTPSDLWLELRHMLKMLLP